MSINTEADKRIQNAKEHIDGAIQDLAKVIIDKVWGYDDYLNSYKSKLREALNELLNTRAKLE